MHMTFYGCASITGSQRTQIKNKDYSPGPATYDPIMKDTHTIPEWTYPFINIHRLKPKIECTGCFNIKNADMPAPGTYDICEKKVIRKSKEKQLKSSKDKQKYYFQRSSPMSQINLPGFVQEKTGFSFGYRDQVIVKEKSPGPVYNIDDKSTTSRKQKVKNSCRGFGYGQRHNLSKDEREFPGPGNYQTKILSKTGGNWSFGKSSKKIQKKGLNPLGPGEYSPKLIQYTRVCKLKGKYPEIKNQSYEASPGSYDIPDTKTKKGAIFKCGPVNQNKIEEEEEGPSPFSYNPMNSTLKSGGCSLGKKIQVIQNKLQNPGPGSYQLQQFYNKKSGGYMGRKPQQKKKASQSQDNFYKYTPKLDAVSSQSPKFSFGTDEGKQNVRKCSELGPGSYTFYDHKATTESFTFPKDNRFKPLMKQKKLNINLGSEDPYSTVGLLPNYLKNSKKQLRVFSKNQENI